MNVFRLTAIAFSLILFSACGGGGGGGGSAGGGGVTPPPPPPPPPPVLESLPSQLITNPAQARIEVSGEDLASLDVKGALESRAGIEGATLLFSDINILSGRRKGETIAIDCNGAECTEVRGQPEFQFSLDDFGDIPRLGGLEGELTRYQEEYSTVMTKTRVMLAQFRAAGRTANGGVISQYQSYGGWLEGSVFAVQIGELMATDEDEDTASLLASYSFGNATGIDPTPSTVTGTATWNGVMVGATGERHVVQGDVEIDIDDLSAPDVDVTFSGITNLSAEGEIRNIMTWPNLQLTDGDGTFRQVDGSDYIRGTFYGAGHEEVGGVFDRSGIVGAFGARR